MSFLSVAFLFALPLISVPIAIHLYRGKQRDVILWGAMQFLTSAVTKGRRFEQLQEWLLMALRLAAVATLILALARPLIHSSWLGSTTDREVILVLDNSLSMSRTVDGESASERMHEQAHSLIDSLANGDGVQVLLAVGGEWATAEGIAADSKGRERLREILAGVQPTLGTANILNALQAAVHLHPGKDITGRRIVIFTDGQASNWQMDKTGAWQQLSSDLQRTTFPMFVEVVDCGFEATELNNLAVDNLHAAQPLVRPGEIADLSAQIANVGEVASGDTQLEWLIDGIPVQVSPLKSLEPRSQTEAKAGLRLEKPGIVTISCRIQNTDQVPLDQEDSFVIEVAEQLPILFVQDESPASAIAAGELISAALGFRHNKPQAWHSVFRPEIIAHAALPNKSLSEYRAIVINNLGNIDQTTIDRLDAFVRAGGGLWVTLGDTTDRLTFNRYWYGDGDGLSPLAIESLAVIDNEDDPAATVHPPTRDHAATGQLANTTQLDIDEARIRQRWKFAEQSATDQAVSTMLESGNGQPLVVEKYVGQGRVIVQTFPLGLEWSNLPLLKAYVVLVQDWLNYVTAPTMARYNLTPWDAIVAAVPETLKGTAVEVHTPSGKTVPLIAADSEFANVIRYTQTRIPGEYRVRFSGAGQMEGEMPFHVARDPNESNVQMLSAAERSQLLAANVSFDGMHHGDDAID